MAAQVVNYAANWIAVATSSALNISFVRSGEITSGISVTNPADQSESFGLSQVAAKEAIAKSAASRFMYTIPIFATTLIVNSTLSKLRLLPKPGRPIAMFVEVASISLGLWIAMPFNCAFFTQHCKINVDRLEPAIRDKAKAKGLTHLIYNKGL